MGSRAPVVLGLERRGREGFQRKLRPGEWVWSTRRRPPRGRDRGLPFPQPAVYMSEMERRFPGSLAAVDANGPRVLPEALPGSAGVMYELCAGIVDQPGLSLEEVACKEAWEECGYRLAPADLRRVATYK